MYQPKHFQEADEAKIEALIHENGFACLVTSFRADEAASSGESLSADHLPLYLRAGKLVGHIAIANPLRKAIQAGAKTLAIFSGPHAYVSPTLYASEAQVPTWNYAVVHIEGYFRAITDEAGTIAVLRELSEKYEKDRNPPWKFEIPEWGQGTLLKQILAFEIDIEKTTAKFKLSQNRDADDRGSVIRAFSRSSHEMEREVARLMKP